MSETVIEIDGITSRRFHPDGSRRVFSRSFFQLIDDVPDLNGRDEEAWAYTSKAVYAMKHSIEICESCWLTHRSLRCNDEH